MYRLIHKDLNYIIYFIFKGMHKKSIEAADKLKDEPGIDDLNNTENIPLTKIPATSHPEEVLTKDKEEFRSESIAALRAKAVSYSAQLRDAMQQDVLGTRSRNLCSSFDPPSSNEDSDSLLDPTN